MVRYPHHASFERGRSSGSDGAGHKFRMDVFQRPHRAPWRGRLSGELTNALDRRQLVAFAVLAPQVFVGIRVVGERFGHRIEHQPPSRTIRNVPQVR